MAKTLSITLLALAVLFGTGASAFALPPGYQMEPPAGGAARPTGPALDEGEADAGEGKDAVENDQGEDEEAESETAPAEAAAAVPRYTVDITDQDLEKRWRESPDSLGSLSIGFTDSGRLVGGVQFPEGEMWDVINPEKAWGTRETIEYVMAAIKKVRERFPDTPPIAVNHLSRMDGGYLRPHKSHQSGRDVDLGFYYASEDARMWSHGHKDNLDLARNWALIRALAAETDVQVILLDRRIQKLIYDYALSIGEDRAWLDSLFKAGHASLVRHVRRHRNHYHVRFYNPRAQELGRRVQPLIGKGKDEQNVVIHKIRNGDCLGAIARKYNTSITAIKKANGLRGNFLRAGRTLSVPILGPCHNCPVPPEMVLPPRRLPPAAPVMFASDGGGGSAASGPPAKPNPVLERFGRGNALMPASRTFALPQPY